MPQHFLECATALPKAQPSAERRRCLSCVWIKKGIGLWLEGKVPQRPGDRLMIECIPQGCQACLLPGDR